MNSKRRILERSILVTPSSGQLFIENLARESCSSSEGRAKSSCFAASRFSAGKLIPRHGFLCAEDQRSLTPICGQYAAKHSRKITEKIIVR